MPLDRDAHGFPARTQPVGQLGEVELVRTLSEGGAEAAVLFLEHIRDAREAFGGQQRCIQTALRGLGRQHAFHHGAELRREDAARLRPCNAEGLEDLFAVESQHAAGRHGCRECAEKARRVPALGQHLVPVHAQAHARTDFEADDDRRQQSFAVDLVGTDELGRRQHRRQHSRAAMDRRRIGIVQFVALDHCAVQQRGARGRRRFVAAPDRGLPSTWLQLADHIQQDVRPFELGTEQAAAQAVQDD
ncbi:hypothetical protein D3C71_1399900 [compost metagenome]